MTDYNKSRIKLSIKIWDKKWGNPLATILYWIIVLALGISLIRGIIN